MIADLLRTAGPLQLVWQILHMRDLRVRVGSARG
jgi:hypothetical protein